MPCLPPLTVTMIGALRRALALAATLAALLAAQTAAAQDFKWMTLKQTRIAVPAGCKTVDSDQARKRCLVREDTGGFFVTLDEFVLLEAKPGAATDPAWATKFIMSDGFEDFAAKSVADTTSHNVTSALVKPADLPKGMLACRSYTFNSRSNSSAEDLTLREHGLYCAVPARGSRNFMVMIGAVTTLVPSEGPGIPASFNPRAKSLLGTFGLR